MKIITLLLSVGLYCCGNAKEAANHQNHTELKSTKTLSGTYKIAFIENNTELPETINITFDETTNTVSGFSGCNNFFGNYSVEGSSIQFSDIGMTRKFCEEFMDVEQNMLNALGQVESFSMTNEVLNLKNKSTKLLTAHKIDNLKLSQENDYIIEYVATTRGFYTQVIIKNGIMSIQKDRDHKAPVETIVCSKENLETLNTLLNKIDFKKLSEYEGPTKKRLYDGAAIANLKITSLDNEYATPSFDHGYPNSNIKEFVNTITSMAKMPQ
jgi:heat shock protein HslJ